MATEGRNRALTADLDALSNRFALCDNNAAITAIVANDRRNRMVALSADTAKVWVFLLASTAAASAGVLVPDDAPAAGRWHVLENSQSGRATLAAGTVTITGVRLTSSSRITTTMCDPGAGAITGLAALNVPAASRDTAAGSFVVTAIDDAKALIPTAVSTFDWVVTDS